MPVWLFVPLALRKATQTEHRTHLQAMPTSFELQAALLEIRAYDQRPDGAAERRGEENRCDPDQSG